MTNQIDPEDTDPSRSKPEPRPEPGDQSPPLVREDKIKGSMHTEEPLGWDQAPQDIRDPEHKRHPRPDGIGGIKPAEPTERKSE